MKHLKIFENTWNKNRIDSFLEEKEEICDLIKDFIIKEYPNVDNLYSVNSFYYIEDASGNEAMIVHIKIKGDYIGYKIDTFLIKELDKLYAYLENPELYDEIKKYNL